MNLRQKAKKYKQENKRLNNILDTSKVQYCVTNIPTVTLEAKMIGISDMPDEFVKKHLSKQLADEIIKYADIQEHPIGYQQKEVTARIQVANLNH